MTRIGIIGGTGYTGGELARILCTHPDVEIAAMTSRQNAGLRVQDVHSYLKGYVDLEFTEKISDTKDLDLVFVATPHGVAMKEIPTLIEQGIKAIDLSGDYRLHDVSVYEKWYGHEHTDVENLQNAVYGSDPEGKAVYPDASGTHKQGKRHACAGVHGTGSLQDSRKRFFCDSRQKAHEHS